MMDVHTPETRSFNMSRIKNRDTKPEKIIRQWLWSRGFRYRLHSAKLPGKPDIVFNSRKKCIFIHGCFWHKHNCRYFKWPRANAAFWEKKINGNALRDQKHYETLTAEGWRLLVIWECELKHPEASNIWRRLQTFMETD